MNSKKILIPAVILVAALVVIVFVNKVSNRSQSEEPAPFFPGATEKNIGAVILQDAQDQVKLQRKGDVWVVIPKQAIAGASQEKAGVAQAIGSAAATSSSASVPAGLSAADFPADSGAISQLLGNIVKIKKTILVSENPDKQETFEVDAGHGSRIEAFDLNGKSLGVVILGKSGSDYSSCYFRSDKSNSVYLVQGADRYALGVDHKRWTDKNILKIDKATVKQISIAKKGSKAITIVRSTDSTVKGWEQIAPEKKPVDSTKVDALLGGLANLQAAEYEDSAYTDSVTGLAEPSLTLTVDLKTGTTRTISVGNEKMGQSKYWLKIPEKPYVYLISDAQYRQFDKKPDDFQNLPPKPEKPATPAKKPAFGKLPVPVKKTAKK